MFVLHGELDNHSWDLVEGVCWFQVHSESSICGCDGWPYPIDNKTAHHRPTCGEPQVCAAPLLYTLRAEVANFVHLGAKTAGQVVCTKTNLIAIAELLRDRLAKSVELLHLLPVHRDQGSRRRQSPGGARDALNDGVAFKSTLFGVASNTGEPGVAFIGGAFARQR